MNNGINLSDPTPLYLQVERDLISQIERGKLKIGDQIGSHQQLSKKYEVSLITVKKALSNLIRNGVLYTRVGKGTYVANKKSAVSHLSKHKSIGLVLRDLKHPFFSLIVHSIEERAYELGFTLLLSSSSGNVEKEEGQIEHFRKLGIDGLIIASLSLEYRATDYIRKLHEEGFPYIMVSYMHDPGYWYVGSDHELGGFMAADHLIKLGYESVGYVNVGEGNLLSAVRERGYFRSVKENNLPLNRDNVFTLSHKNHIEGLDRFKLGYEFGLRFSELKKKTQALVLYSDSLAMGFLKACSEKGVNVPADVAIVGFDDIEIAKHASTPLTTIRQNHNIIGSKAVDIIQKRIEGVKINNRTILKPTLVIRDSCGSRLITQRKDTSKKTITFS